MEEKIDTYFYVFYNSNLNMYYSGCIYPWTDNLNKEANYCKDLVTARERKKSILKRYKVDCKIIKVNFLEIE